MSELKKNEMAGLFDDNFEFTMEGGKKEIDAYLDCILIYLKTHKTTIKPKQHMKTYTYIIKLSDETDEAG